MKPILSVFADSPDQGQGQARDMPVRWAFEEVGLPYDVRPVPWKQFKEPAHRARNPFGQIPTIEEGKLTLFESGAIVLHIAEAGEGLLPRDAEARARAITWMFAAVTTIQMPIVDREVVEYLEGDKPWAHERMAMVDDRIRGRFGELAAHLGGGEWLDGDFSAGDLLMVTVLRRLEGSDLLSEFPTLCAFVERGKDRPAFKRAFAGQKAVFEASVKA
ncbi:MAG TPA: glutathione S-transferase family protein [Sphingomicrobium sp.]|nr:glutathione S-transferase family protein [Sphingomicrobium sp.]